MKFLEGLGFSNSNGRATINVLKSLGLLDDTGVPTKRCHEYLDQTQSATVLATAIRQAYADLFRVNRSAQTMGAQDVKNKMKTLLEGQFTDRVLSQMATTFTTLVKLGDFSGTVSVDSSQHAEPPSASEASRDKPQPEAQFTDSQPQTQTHATFWAAYNINIHLPESRDQAVYDALFKAPTEHLA